jgi:hypothetical protein
MQLNISSLHKKPFPNPYLRKIKYIIPTYYKRISISHEQLFYSLYCDFYKNNIVVNKNTLNWGECECIIGEEISTKEQNINNDYIKRYSSYINKETIQIKNKEKINEYKNEKNRVISMKNCFNNINKKKIKPVHLSNKCRDRKFETSKTNVRECVEFIKNQTNFRGDISSQTIDFIYVIINILYQYYIETLEYQIDLLINEPYYSLIEKYIYTIESNDFQFDESNFIFKIKHFNIIESFYKKTNEPYQNGNYFVIQKINDDDINTRYHYDFLFEI